MSKQDKAPDKNGDIARNIWLAGLGAYGRAFDEAVHRYEKASKDSPKLFKDLVKRGQELEKETRSKVTKSDLGKTTSTLEERLKQVPRYVELFREVYDEAPSYERALSAIAAFERSLDRQLEQVDTPLNVDLQQAAEVFVDDALSLEAEIDAAETQWKLDQGAPGGQWESKKDQIFERIHEFQDTLHDRQEEGRRWATRCA